MKADWVVSETPEKTVDQAHLVLTFREYNRFATRANPKLPKKFFRVNLKITPARIEEERVTKRYRTNELISQTDKTNKRQGIHCVDCMWSRPCLRNVGYRPVTQRTA